MKDKNIKYIHYFPQFLLKNWGTFLERYSLIDQSFIKDNINIKKVASYKRQSRNQNKLWEETESKWNSEYKYKGVELENYLSRIFKTTGKTPDEIVASIRKVKTPELELFMKMLIFKAPNTRISKHFYSTMGQSGEKRRYEDSDLLVLYDSLDNNNQEAFDKLKGKKFVVLAVNFPLPFIDPGFNMLNLNGDFTFIVQMSPHIVLISSTDKVLNEIRTIEKMSQAQRYEEILKILIGSNFLLKDIYFSKHEIDSLGIKNKKEIANIIQEEYDKIEDKKIVGSIAMMTAPNTKYSIPIYVNGIEIIFSVACDSKDSLMKGLINNERVKYFFTNIEISNDIKRMKMYDLSGHMVSINDNILSITKI